MKLRKTLDYKDISIDKTFELLETDFDGLNDVEVKKGIEFFGYNEIKKQSKNPILKFLSYYWGPMQWLLEFTMIISGILGHYTKLIIIFILLTINTFISFLNNRKSARVLEFLEKKLSIKLKILRFIRTYF